MVLTAITQCSAEYKVSDFEWDVNRTLCIILDKGLNRHSELWCDVCVSQKMIACYKLEQNNKEVPSLLPYLISKCSK